MDRSEMLRTITMGVWALCLFPSLWISRMLQRGGPLHPSHPNPANNGPDPRLAFSRIQHTRPNRADRSTTRCSESTRGMRPLGLGWKENGRKVGSSNALPRECTSPNRPIWKWECAVLGNPPSRRGKALLRTVVHWAVT